MLIAPGGSGNDPTELALQAVDDSGEATGVDELVIGLGFERSHRLLQLVHLEQHGDILQTFVREIQHCSVNLRESGPPDPTPTPSSPSKNVSGPPNRRPTPPSPSRPSGPYPLGSAAFSIGLSSASLTGL